MFRFTSSEVRDLIIAFIVISLCFAIVQGGRNTDVILSILPIVMIGVGAGFILHELGHKFVSMKYGYWAEFKLWPQGLIFALITSFFGFVFAAPGAVYTYANYMTDEINGKISNLCHRLFNQQFSGRFQLASDWKPGRIKSIDMECRNLACYNIDSWNFNLTVHDNRR